MIHETSFASLSQFSSPPGAKNAENSKRSTRRETVALHARQGGNVLSLPEEFDNLRQADAHIANALRRVEFQQRLIASMLAGSEQRARAESLLVTMQATLEQFMFQRESIRDGITRLQEPSPGETP
jgi:hypothetical protein